MRNTDREEAGTRLAHYFLLAVENSCLGSMCVVRSMPQLWGELPPGRPRIPRLSPLVPSTPLTSGPPPPNQVLRAQTPPTATSRPTTTLLSAPRGSGTTLLGPCSRVREARRRAPSGVGWLTREDVRGPESLRRPPRSSHRTRGRTLTRETLLPPGSARRSAKRVPVSERHSSFILEVHIYDSCG